MQTRRIPFPGEWGRIAAQANASRRAGEKDDTEPFLIDFAPAA
jgi:hypothetical protein